MEQTINEEQPMYSHEEIMDHLGVFQVSREVMVGALFGKADQLTKEQVSKAITDFKNQKAK